jgi:MinD-like ATPase involved in chromosome partitioning or flagellar assembly
VPLDPSVSDASDRGIPSVLAAPAREQARAFAGISRRLAAQISISAMTEAGLEPAGASAGSTD